MMRYSLLIYIYFSYSIVYYCYSQNVCDGNKCYQNYLFHSFPDDSILIEKKWESDILVNSNTQPIICDLNNDGKTEILVPKKLDDNLKNYSDKLSILNGQN